MIFFQAVEWFTRAADSGDSNAMYNLGVLFTQGMGGVPENPKLAFTYFSKVRFDHR
jgi:TPR repeat protein